MVAFYYINDFRGQLLAAADETAIRMVECSWRCAIGAGSRAVLWQRNVQPLPPLPWKCFLVPQPRSESPHASVATSAQSSLLRGPSVPQIGGPQDKLNDNVKTLTCNAARALNILKTPEFPGGGNGAQPPSAHELVYLSDDD
ncbi:hypothetical protein Tco_0453312 [Tanacetum coccineum]